MANKIHEHYLRTEARRSLRLAYNMMPGMDINDGPKQLEAAFSNLKHMGNERRLAELRQMSRVLLKLDELSSDTEVLTDILEELKSI